MSSSGKGESNGQKAKKAKLENEDLVELRDDNGEECYTSSSDFDDNEDDEKEPANSVKKEETDRLLLLKRKSKNASIEENAFFHKTMEDEPDMNKYRKIWLDGESPEDKNLKVCQKPFRHAELKNFVSNKNFIEGFKSLFDILKMKEKASDLFQFYQSYDLNSIVDPFVYAISQYLHEKVLPFVKRLTGLPLNQTIDMFLSIYRHTDFLLCHDDELDSRRVAFIWYLSEEWSEDYGGTLDLFSATESLHPGKIIKKIVPEFNKFVFFEVGATSYHQVSEVLMELGEPRLALSGWFYGEPLPRPVIEYTNENVAYSVLESCKDFKGIMNRTCNEDYIMPQIHKELNEMLCKDSQLFIPSFLRHDVYKKICESIIETDVSNPDFFKRRGPINMQNFEEAIEGHSDSLDSSVQNSSACEGCSSSSTSSSGTSYNKNITVHTLRDLFHSKEFLGFLESVTEFPFTTLDTNRMTSSLQKYTHGCFQLLKPGLMGRRKTHDTENHVNDAEETEEEPNYVDILLYFAHKWNYDWGGEEVYCCVEDEGTSGDQEQVMSIHPDGNSLAIAVRTSSVIPFTKYINCLAKDDVYFVYKARYAFDGNF